jgi:hypothetical protein
MAKKNLWPFRIYDAATGKEIEEVKYFFFGADSEEAFVICNEWAMKKYKQPILIHCEQVA